MEGSFDATGGDGPTDGPYEDVGRAISVSEFAGTSPLAAADRRTVRKPTVVAGGGGGGARRSGGTADGVDDDEDNVFLKMALKRSSMIFGSQGRPGETTSRCECV